MHKRILVVDDDSMNLMRTKMILGKEYDVLFANSGIEALEKLRHEQVDLVLLDIALPDGDGFAICRQIKEKAQIPVIFLTAREEEADVVRGLDLGADDYVIKPFRNRELVSRIKGALRRNGKGSAILRCGDIVLDAGTGKVKRGDVEISLTRLEYKILSNMMSCPGKLFTRDRILEDIWDISGNFVNDNTLSVTMKRLREKLGDSEGTVIRTVRGMGYRMER